MASKRKLPNSSEKLPDAEIDPEILPNPGSEEAVEAGCLCPILDNRHGEGVGDDENGNRLFWYSSDCALHCADSAAAHSDLH